MTRSQIKIIHGIGLLYSGDERLFRFGARYQQDLERFCQERWQFGTDDVQLNESESIDAQHRTWINSEMRNRTGYCIWVSYIKVYGISVKVSNSRISYWKR